jgi:hypothetical protein
MERRKKNGIWVVGDTAFIDVSTSKFKDAYAIIDTSDLPLVEDGGWFVQTANGEASLMYARRRVRNGGEKKEFMHCLILETSHEVDHRNSDGLDNRKNNLRKATRNQNRRHSRPKMGCESGFRGVDRIDDSDRWRARIGTKGKRTHLGCFASAVEAAAAYDDAATRRYGEFAWLNFPTSRT